MTQDRFIQLYDELADDLFSYCYLRVPDRDKAKEIVEEAFRRAWLKVRDHKGHKHLLLYKLTNGLFDEYKKERKVPLTVYSYAGLIAL